MKTGMLLDSADFGGVNQILPHKHKYVWDLFLKAVANSWSPAEVSMQKDVEQWKGDTITDDERLLIKRCLGFFAGSESLVANNLLLNIFKNISDAECKQYIGRQNYEELLHNWTIVYICDSLNLDINEVYEAYQNIPSIKAKDDFLINITKDINRQDFTIETIEGKREFLRNAITYYIVCEGILFYSGFAMLLSFNRQNKIPGIGEQVNLTMKDECLIQDTELLTKSGWKKIQNLSNEDKIGQYNEDGTIEFVHPIKVSKCKPGKMYRFKNYENSVHLCVTENHRMIFRTRSSGKLIERIAGNTKFNPTNNHKHIVSGKLKTNNQSKLTIEERMMIAIQSDGWISGNKVSFHLTKDRKKERIRNLTKETGWRFKERIDNVKENTIFFDIWPPEKYITKEFSDWINLEDKSYEWCHDFIDEVKNWDGFIRSGSSTLGYGSTNKSNIDIVQAIAILAGYKTNITMAVDDRKESYKDYYRMSIIESDYRGGAAIEKTEEETDADFYGVEVPSGMLVVRYDDCVSITGNSIHIEFGTYIVNTIKQQYPEIWTKEFEEETIEHIKKAVELEIAYAKDVLPNGVLGLNAEMFIDYMQYIGNRRLRNIGIKEQFPSTKNPFPWLSEIIDLEKNKNFFETRVVDYQVGNIVDDL